MNYDDIIALPHPTSPRRARMSMKERGAQFAPFAALTGYDAAIQETARLTNQRIELTEGEKLRLNEQLCAILEHLPARDGVQITYFRPDKRKDGGEYVTQVCAVRGLEPYGRGLLLKDGRMIAFEDIIALEEVSCTP